MAMPGGGREAFLALLDAIAARLPALSPLARSLVAGLLVGWRREASRASEGSNGIYIYIYIYIYIHIFIYIWLIGQLHARMRTSVHFV